MTDKKTPPQDEARKEAENGARTQPTRQSWRYSGRLRPGFTLA